MAAAAGEAAASSCTTHPLLPSLCPVCQSPLQGCTSCSWPEGQVLLFLPSFDQSFYLLRPGPLSPIPYVRKRGLDPAASCTAPWPAMTHTPAPQSPGLWLHLPLAPSQLLSMCWVLSSEEQHCHANPSALFCFPLAHPALCMAEGLPAILFLFTKHVPT